MEKKIMLTGKWQIITLAFIVTGVVSQVAVFFINISILTSRYNTNQQRSNATDTSPENSLIGDLQHQIQQLENYNQTLTQQLYKNLENDYFSAWLLCNSTLDTTQKALTDIKNRMLIDCQGVCQETITANNVSDPSICRLSRSGSNYIGSVNHTYDGTPCQNWNSNTPHFVSKVVSTAMAANPQSMGGNHCRNPDGEPMPWCYTTDPNIRFQFCYVPRCP